MSTRRVTRASVRNQNDHTTNPNTCADEGDIRPPSPPHTLEHNVNTLSSRVEDLATQMAAIQANLRIISE